MANQNPDKIDLMFKILDKLEVLNDKIHEIESDRIKDSASVQSILSKQEHNLFIHIKRTDIAEENIEILKNEIKPVLQGLGFLKTIVKVVSFVTGLFVAYTKLKK